MSVTRYKQLGKKMEMATQKGWGKGDKSETNVTASCWRIAWNLLAALDTSRIQTFGALCHPVPLPHSLIATAWGPAETSKHHQASNFAGNSKS